MTVTAVDRASDALEAELTMGTEPHQLQRVVIGLAIDQHEIGAHVAVAVIVPFPREGMIMITGWQGCVGGEHVDDFSQQGVQPSAVPAFLLAFMIAAEACRFLNRPR
jgi:hypothetical protein